MSVGVSRYYTQEEAVKELEEIINSIKCENLRVENIGKFRDFGDRNLWLIFLSAKRGCEHGN